MDHLRVRFGAAQSLKERVSGRFSLGSPIDPDFRFKTPKLILILTSDANIYAGSSVNTASGGRNPVGERQNQPFQFSFNAALKVDFQGSRVTSDGGLILVREVT